MRRGVFSSRWWVGAVLLLTAAACTETPLHKSYTNPLSVSIPGGGTVENCADPTIIRGKQTGDYAWYMYCTSDPLNDQDRDSEGQYRQHLIAMLKSNDLVEWTYVGDAFTERPDWAEPTAGLWAPEIEYFGNKYHLYYTVTDSKQGDSAIGVATSDSPTGPWTHAAKPVVEPHEAPCCGGSQRWVYDPEVLVEPNGDKYIYYGSYYGGISVRKLSADGASSDPYSQVEVTVANRYEGASIIKRGEYYYLLGSSGDCCNGAVTGYNIFAGRSKSPLGPFVDREGVRLTYNRVGGTPVLGLNGNRWVGTGHNGVLTDFGGQDWLVYHAVDRDSPYFAPPEKGARPVKRHVMMDPLDWVDGWPTVRGGSWASDTEQPAPAAQPGEKSRYQMTRAKDDAPGAVITSDEFDGTSLGSQWTWIRPPAENDFGLESGSLRFATQGKELHQDDNSASVLTLPAPVGNYLVETQVSLNLPPVSCCHNYVQAGLVIHGDDNHYVKLTHVSNWETRQIAFAKEVGPESSPRYGETFGGPADETVWLRIAKRDVGGEQHYTAYSSRDGSTWTRAGTWTHQLGSEARIGLVSMSGGGFIARFEYVRVHELAAGM
ncbi:family 43 glycosylhydrolase [Archangium lipolyticum]|uniref:family 43 glycosylhydrolase n=1 Tax=Archangium lipolyticum TaxID=2970465 RepID=UPI002149F6AF|nr:family 43 glycosylhydrolase [Archangium lipolyticum]